MNNLDAYTVANNHNSRPGPPAVSKVTVILPAYNEEVSIGSIILRSKQHADRVIVIDDGSTDRTPEVAELAGAIIKIKPQIHSPLAELSACYVQGRAGSIKEPQIHSPPLELSACYARWRAGNTDEHRYDYNKIINIFQPGRTTSNPSQQPQPLEVCT